MSGRRALAALALLLAACEGPAPGLQAQDVTTVHEVRVISAAGDGLVAHASELTRTVPANGAIPGSTDRQWSWQVLRGALALRRLNEAELAGYRSALAAMDDAGTLWTAQDLDDPERVRLCFRRADDETRCQEQRLPVADPLSRPRMARALSAGQAGYGVLLAQAAGGWSTLWMDASTPNPQWQWLELPAAAREPLLMSGRSGASLAWHDGADLRLQELAADRTAWRDRFTAPGATAWWAGARQRGAQDGTWLVFCPVQGAPVSVWRFEDAQPPRELPSPPTPACGAATGRPQLVVSDNGDALLLWTQADARWRAAHWKEAAAAWSAATLLEGLGDQPQLAADEQGHFALLSRSSDGPLRLWAFRAGDGWQPPLEIDPAPVNYDIGPSASGLAECCAGVAASAGRALVAWVRPFASQVIDTRLATTFVDLAVDQAELQVQVEGQGSLVSTPPGIQCPGDCRASQAVGTSITLEARPADGHRFAGWSGACGGAGPRIDVTLVAGGIDCIVRFEPQATFALTLTTQGAGRASADPAAPAHPPGTEVRLTATPDGGQRFVAWAGDADCADGRVTMDGPRACTAVFEPDPGQVALTLSVNGGGRVVSTPAGLVCTGACQAWFALGQTVVLSAEPPPGANTRWSGACSAAVGLSATVVLGAAQQCAVDFEVPVPSGWQALGGLLPGSGGIVGLPSIAADAQGVPTVAFIAQLAEFRELQVLRLVGGGWQRVGNGPLNDPLVSANEPSLALDGQGRPLVAFSDARGRVQVRHWDGNQWRHLADDLSLAAGAVTSSPQIAFDGQRAVVALLEYQGGRARPVLLRSALDTPAWSGSVVAGVQLDGSILLRLALDATGQATLAYVSGSGVAGEQAPRVVQEGAAGWAQRCDGGAGLDPGTSYLLNQLGFGLQGAADGASLVLRPSNDARAVQAWRCNGSGAWVLDGPGGGALVAVDNVNNYLQAVAMGRSGPPTAAVLVGTGYAGSSELHAFVHGAAGFQSAGVPLVVPSPGVLGVLGVAHAAPGSPVAAYGVEAAPGSRELRAARFYP